MPNSAIRIDIEQQRRHETEQLVDEAGLLLAERRLILHLDVREVLHGVLDRRVDVGERHALGAFTSTKRRAAR